MTDAEALDYVITHTGHTKFREQIAANPDYWAVVRQFARDIKGGPLIRPLTLTIAENRLIRTCADRDIHCGCDLPTCQAMLGDHDDGAKSSRENCLRCLTAWSLV